MSEKQQAPITSESTLSDERYRRQSDLAKDARRPFTDSNLPPIHPSDEMRRGPHYEHGQHGSVQSPRTSSGSSLFGPGQSPLPSHQQQRSLPSPPGSQFSISAMSNPSSYSITANQAAQASHLQDLQHQISTKTLALQTLQREHDQLLAAFSRSQIRCNTLDKKSQVSDHEINTLTEEKIRLQQQVDALEAQVEDLQKSRDEVHKQNSADGAQWRQIMAMSSQLQVKGAEDARRFKAERDAWEEDRSSLERRISELERHQAPEHGTTYQSTTPHATSPIHQSLATASVEALRSEVIRLRSRCNELELVLQDVSGETEQLDRAISAMSSMRQKLASSSTKRQAEAG
jgi:hypothetical protein